MASALIGDDCKNKLDEVIKQAYAGRPARRLRTVSISAELILNWLRSPSERVEVVDGRIPDDAEVVHITADPYGRCTFMLTLESESFDPVEAYETPPAMWTAYRRVRD